MHVFRRKYVLFIFNRFVIFDLKNKITFIFWKPEGCKPMDMMKYNSIKNSANTELGSFKEVEINNKEDLIKLNS